MRPKKHLDSGFTLIKLFIAGGAIPAAMATPNLLQAHTRARLSRAKGDIRTLSLAVEQDHADYTDSLSVSSHSDVMDWNAWPSVDSLKALGIA